MMQHLKNDFLLMLNTGQLNFPVLYEIYKIKREKDSLDLDFTNFLKGFEYYFMLNNNQLDFKEILIEFNIATIIDTKTNKISYYDNNQTSQTKLEKV
jgi:hypothetical protein